ncbi:acylneuraminate cytidylyltransferase family protein [Bdellovibrio bacteriovorus]|uniref:acylneuraminate cytidylyltransferase family protein n=1 Tax=Bdellovibrio bacteriovorus TaxID=959 RepID=UPI0002F63507|nr:acylneuraminate cytidylyltransferase family protein [Bdellovibrio bacteriovorus]
MGSLAIIPARAGSRRLPGKNKRNFAGKPLVQWTIEAALDSSEFSCIVVSSDDLDVLSLVEKFPSVLFLERDPRLSSDSATSVDVMLDVIDRVGAKFQTVTLLQPTSPLRDSDCIRNAFSFYRSCGFKQVVSARDLKENVNHLAVVTDGKLNRIASDKLFMTEGSSLVALNGAIYISEFDYFRAMKSLFTESTTAFLMEALISIDIDYEDDWQKAESVALALGKAK